jgi:hypothetical protein
MSQDDAKKGVNVYINVYDMVNFIHKYSIGFTESVIVYEKII